MPQVRTSADTTLAQKGVYIYVPAAFQLDEQLRLASSVGGIVLPGWAGVAAARRLRAQGYTGRLLVDPGAYSDVTRRDDEGERLLDVEPDWLDAQARLNVDAVLSPSEYVAKRDYRGLARVMRAGSVFCERAAKAGLASYLVLPMSMSLLVEAPDRLIKTLAGCEHRIALVLADRNDPLGSKRAVSELVRVLRTVPNVAVLRSDQSAVGATAYGAKLGAIGVTSATRHLVPPNTEGGGSRGDHSPSLFVDLLGAFHRGSTLERLENDDGKLGCPCAVCDGESLRRFADPRLKAEARRHSVEAWSALAKRILQLPQANDRRTAWHEYCKKSEWAREELEERTGVVISRRGAIQGWIATDP